MGMYDVVQLAVEIPLVLNNHPKTDPWWNELDFSWFFYFGAPLVGIQSSRDVHHLVLKARIGEGWTDTMYFANAISLGTHFCCLYPCNTLIVLDVSPSNAHFLGACQSFFLARYTWKSIEVNPLSLFGERDVVMDVLGKLNNPLSY